MNTQQRLVVKFVYDNMDIPETQALLINVNPGMEYTNNKAEGCTMNITSEEIRSLTDSVEYRVNLFRLKV